MPLYKEQLRRVKKLRVRYDFLCFLLSLRGDYLVRIDGIPADARIVGIRDCFDREEVELKIESAEFPETGPDLMVWPMKINASAFDVNYEGATREEIKNFARVEPFQDATKPRGREFI